MNVTDEALQKAQHLMASQVASLGFQDRQGNHGDGGLIKSFLQAFPFMEKGQTSHHDFRPLIDKWDRAMAKSNAVARALRQNPRGAFGDPRKLMGEEAFRKAGEAAVQAEILAKSTLDVGQVTDLAAVTNGQALGMVSMDMRMARGTVRPKSFTLWNMLHKTAANQIVDFFPYASERGGTLPGGAFTTFASQTQPIQSDNGSYKLNSILLKLAVNGRSITMALANQNSYVNIVEQEEANAVTTILESIDWALYWGNSSLYPSQPNGIAVQIPAKNQFDFQSYLAQPDVLALGVSPQQALFNQIYEVAGQVSNYRNNGQFTHAMMPNSTIADLQSLVTTNLRNIVDGGYGESRAIVVNGDLHGMKTRFGDIQFALDFFISAREYPAQAVVLQDGSGNNMAMTSIVAAASVAGATVAAGNAAATGSAWTPKYTVNGNGYTYAVAATDGFMNESVLTFSPPVTGVAATGAVTLTVTPGAGSNAVNFRIFRSGLGYVPTVGQNPASFRFIGTVAANGTNAVTFTDLNTKIPGSDTIFLLDMDDEDNALDYRFLLPLTKIDLFSQALYMPFAVAHIGAPRLRIPKWHAIIRNYVPTLPGGFNPLLPNPNAPPL